MRLWHEAGVWLKLHAMLLAELNGADKIDWERALIDASFAKAPEGGENTGPNPTDRSKSGSKHHVMTDAQGIPLSVTVTAANVNEVTQVLHVLTNMPPVGGKPGPERQIPIGFKATVATTRNRCGNSSVGWESLPSSPPATPNTAAVWGHRWFVERTISWLHAFGRLRRRLDRLTEIQDAFLQFACCHHLLEVHRTDSFFPNALKVRRSC